MVIGSLDAVEIGKGTTVGTLTVRLTGLRRFVIRRAIGVALIRMGVAVLPVGVNVEYD